MDGGIRLILIAAAVAASASARAAQEPKAVDAGSQKYPEKPIRLLVVSPAGGTADLIARVIAQKLYPVLGQSVIVDNRTGATGTVAAEATAQAAPDGYTFMMTGPPSLTISVALHKGKMTYHPEKDLIPVAIAGKVPLAFTVLPGLPAKNIKEFIALAKSKAGRINYGSAGIGSTNHLTGELFKVETGISMTHVPFRGGANALAALMASELELYIATVPTIMPMVPTGRVRVLAVSSLKRSTALPEIPTVAESGLPGFELTSWFCMVGPTGIPRPIVTRLNAEITKILNAPDSRERLTASGVNVETMTPEEIAVFLKAETRKLGKVVKDAGIKVEG